jgi:hypothetical protein
MSTFIIRRHSTALRPKGARIINGTLNNIYLSHTQQRKMPADHRKFQPRKYGQANWPPRRQAGCGKYLASNTQRVHRPLTLFAVIVFFVLRVTRWKVCHYVRMHNV